MLLLHLFIMENLILDINELYKTSAFVIGAIFGLFCAYVSIQGTSKERETFLGLVLGREQELTNQL